MPSEDGTARSPLFSLPTELRTEIWKLTLIPSKIFVASPGRPVKLQYFTGSEDWSERYQCRLTILSLRIVVVKAILYSLPCPD